jgi:hypothetical protein
MKADNFLPSNLQYHEYVYNLMFSDLFPLLLFSAVILLFLITVAFYVKHCIYDAHKFLHENTNLYHASYVKRFALFGCVFFVTGVIGTTKYFIDIGFCVASGIGDINFPLIPSILGTYCFYVLIGAILSLLSFCCALIAELRWCRAQKAQTEHGV